MTLWGKRGENFPHSIVLKQIVTCTVIGLDTSNSIILLPIWLLAAEPPPRGTNLGEVAKREELHVRSASAHMYEYPHCAFE